jgi:hypothetical protein
MADTNLNVFANGVASYLTSCIFPSVVQGFAAKGVFTSVDELLMMTNTPNVLPSVLQNIPAPAIPSMAFGGAVPSMSPSVAPTSARKTTATSVPVAGHSCMYQYKRGENKGKYCGKPTAPGTEFCNTCVKTRKNLVKDMSSGAIPGVSPAMGTVPGMSGLPPGYNAPVPMMPNATTAPADPGQLSVVEYDLARGLYREPNHNFIVHQIRPGVIAVLGRLNGIDNKIVNLTPQEQQTAQAIGLIIADNETAMVAEVPNAIPSIPSTIRPSPNAIPSIPNINTSSSSGLLHQHTGSPTLPVISPLGGMSTNALTPLMMPPPAHGDNIGVLSIPGIPQVSV